MANTLNSVLIVDDHDDEHVDDHQHHDHVDDHENGCYVGGSDEEAHPTGDDDPPRSSQSADVLGIGITIDFISIPYSRSGSKYQVDIWRMKYPQQCDVDLDWGKGGKLSGKVGAS